MSSIERVELPDEIKLCGCTIDLNYGVDLKAEDGSPCYGLADTTGHTIELEGSMRGHDKIRFILAHEVSHFIEDFAGLNLKESQVDSIARSLLSLIIDNPQLVAWIAAPKPVRKRKAKPLDEYQPAEGNGPSDS